MATSNPAKARPGRNDPCPCGSGKKYKACCAATDARFRTGPAPNLSALLTRGRQAIDEGDFVSVELWYREILSLDPQNAEALASVGQCLCRKKRKREGLRYLQQAARQVEKDAAKTRDTRLANELCSQLQHWGDMDGALRLAQLSVKLAPRSAVAHNNLALCLSRVNRTVEAIPAADRACELLPGHPACLTLRAVLSVHAREYADARERLEAVIAANRDPVQTARAWLELANVRDKLGEYDQAFAACWQAAELHRALPETHAVDADSIFDTLDRERTGYDRNLLRRWAADGFDDGLPAPVFLFGFLRSGTTLTEQVLAAHPRIITSDENDFIFELTHELERLTGIARNNPAALRALTTDQARSLRRYYWERVEQEFGPEALQRKFVDKLALNSISTGLIATLFPDASILFALRDPRDICISCFMQAFTLSPGTVNLLSWDGIARQYAAVMDLWLTLRDQIPCRYLELRYEDTVGDFEATYRKVFDLIEVEWLPEVARFHENVQGRFISTPSFTAVNQPLYSSAVARWRRYENHFAPVIERLRAYINALGYEDTGTIT
jgi:tetratricopeptide (TPR) repeat protein